jgi:hypothetical protein|tara:strand:- start:1415 stop:2050 length:636 start_codon:yes stop_codon:yes gene_type:complete
MELGEYGMKPYLLRLVVCMSLCVSLNSFGAEVTYRFSKTADNPFTISTGSLFFPSNEEAYLDWTYDPEEWSPRPGSSGYYEGTASVSLHVGSFTTSKTGYAHVKYTSYSNGSQEINFQTHGAEGTGYLFDINLYPSFRTELHGMSLLNLLTEDAWGALPNVHLLKNFSNDNAVAWNIENISEINLSEVPLPAGIYLFLTGLVGLGLIKKSK